MVPCRYPSCRSPFCRKLLSAVALLLLLGVSAPAVAQVVIPASVDLFATSGSPATTADFSSDPLPADFFCRGSAPFAGTIGLVGQPLVTNPPGVAGNANTIVARLRDVVLQNAGDMATVPVKVQALSLVGANLFSVACVDRTTTWQVRACLCDCDCGDQETTSIKITLEDPDCGCGTFSGDLSLNVCLTFTEVDTGEVRGPVQRPVKLTIVNMPWCTQGPPDVITPTSAFEVDANCDGCTNKFLPAATGFVPGATCGAGSCQELEPQCHEAGAGTEHLHCVEPPCERELQTTTTLDSP